MKKRTLVVRPFGEPNPECSGPSQSSQPLDHRHFRNLKLCLDYIHPPLEYEPALRGKCCGSVVRKCCGSVVGKCWEVLEKIRPPTQLFPIARAHHSCITLCITFASPLHHLCITSASPWNYLGMTMEYNWNSIGIQLASPYSLKSIKR